MTTGKVAPEFHRNLGAWGSATRARHSMPGVSRVSDRPRQSQRTSQSSGIPEIQESAQLNILQTVVLTDQLQHAEHSCMRAEAELRLSARSADKKNIWSSLTAD
jgi:hypothetical protein